MLISQPSLLEYQDFHKKIKEKDVIADPCLRRDMLVRVYPCTLYAGQSALDTPVKPGYDLFSSLILISVLLFLLLHIGYCLRPLGQDTYTRLFAVL